MNYYQVGPYVSVVFPFFLRLCCSKYGRCNDGLLALNVIGNNEDGNDIWPIVLWFVFDLGVRSYLDFILNLEILVLWSTGYYKMPVI